PGMQSMRSVSTKAQLKNWMLTTVSTNRIIGAAPSLKFCGRNLRTRRENMARKEGTYIPKAVKRVHVAKDPVSKATLKMVTRHDLVSGLRVNQLIGSGKLRCSNEPYLTLIGQYG